MVTRQIMKLNTEYFKIAKARNPAASPTSLCKVRPESSSTCVEIRALVKIITEGILAPEYPSLEASPAAPSRSRELLQADCPDRNGKLQCSNVSSSTNTFQSKPDGLCNGRPLVSDAKVRSTFRTMRHDDWIEAYKMPKA